jgi:sarcosine oxidase subunit beta
MKTYDVVIIGAGSVGVPLSFYLTQRKLKVLVLEELPSVGRGQNRAAIGGIRATHSDAAKTKICQRTIEIISRMKSEHGLDVDWIAGGYLYPVYDDKNETVFKKLIEFQKSVGLHIDWIGPSEIEKLVPGITMDNLRGGSYSAEDGSASPLKVIDAYFQLSRRLGCEFHFMEKVIGFSTKSAQIKSVSTDKGQYACGLVINAAGAYARQVGESLNLNLPVFPDCHEGGITEPVKRFFEPMVVDVRPDSQSSNYYFYQNIEGQVVFCITPDPKILGTDCDSTSVFLPLVAKRMLALYPRLRHLRIRRTWRGLYPMTPDGFPIVGFTREFKNLFLTIGMCGQGFMIGPGLGAIATEIIIDKSQKYNDILEQLSLYRNFGGQEILK